MTYDIYAMWPTGSYLIASSNNAEHGSEVADRVCKQLGHWPHGFAVLTRGEATLKGPVFGLEDLKRKGSEHGY